MAYAVEMFFDPAADQFIRDIWHSLDEAHLGRSLLAGGVRPHVTLGMCDQLFRADLLAETLQPVFLDAQPITFGLSSTGLFHSAEGVIFFSVTVTRRLLELHAAFYSILVAYAQKSWGYYQPDQWTPHCTLAIGLELQNISPAVEITMQARLPLLVQVPEIGIIEVTPEVTKILELIKIGD